MFLESLCTVSVKKKKKWDDTSFPYYLELKFKKMGKNERPKLVI